MATPSRKTVSPSSLIGPRREGVPTLGSDGRQSVKSFGELAALLGGNGVVPIGGLYFSTVSTDPAIALGFGSWELWATGIRDTGDVLKVTLE